jgi:hypothetical protein
VASDPDDRRARRLRLCRPLGRPPGLLVKTNSQGWLVLAIMAVITGLLAAGATSLDQTYRWHAGCSVVRGNGPCFVARIVPYLWALARIALAR